MSCSFHFAIYILQYVLYLQKGECNTSNGRLVILPKHCKASLVCHKTDLKRAVDSEGLGRRN